MMLWTLTQPTTAATTTVIITLGNTVSTLDAESEDFRQAVLKHRARMQLYQTLQAAPRALPGVPREARRPSVKEPRKRLSLLGQTHRMGRS